MTHDAFAYSRIDANIARASLPDELREQLGPDDDLIAVSLSAMHLRAAGLDVTRPEIFALAIEGARTLPDDHPATSPDLTVWTRDSLGALRPDEQIQPVVYYARLGNRVKIGTTVDIKKRMSGIQPEQLLVTEPGGYGLEAERHRQFAALRTSGEWFRLEAPLTTHIQQLVRAAD